jgi:methyl-accepting chemotaxis protein
VAGSAFGTRAPRGKRSGLPIGVHVVFGIGALLALLAASILIALVLVSRLGSDGERLGDRSIPYLNAIAAAALSAKGVANDERGFLITGDQRFVREANHRIEEARQAFVAASHSASNVDERAAAEEAGLGFEQWVGALHHEFASFRVGERSATIGATLGPNRKLRKQYERSLVHAQTLGAHVVEMDMTSVDTAAEHSLTILLAYLAGALAVGTAIGVWLVRAILRPVYLLLALLSDPEPVTGA